MGSPCPPMVGALKPNDPMHFQTSWVFAAAAFGVACGGAHGADNTSFSDTPFATMASEQSKLVIEVRTAPAQPPERGVNSVQLLITDMNGVPQDGIDLTSKPWMPAMGHGSAVEPTVTARGKGTYVLDNVYLYMAGHWE